MVKKLIRKLRTPGFWVTLAGAIALVISHAGFAELSGAVQKVAEGIAAVLLACGIIVSPAKEEKTEDITTQESDKTKETE